MKLIDKLKNHFELGQIDSGFDNTNTIAYIKNSDEEAQKDADARVIYYYNGKYYLESPGISEGKLDNEQQAALSAGQELTLNTDPATDKLYAWKISNNCFNRLTKGEHKQLQATGLAGELLHKYFDFVYNNNKNTTFTVHDIELLHDAIIKHALENHVEAEKENFKTHWNRTAKSIGFADGLWAFLGPLLYFIPKEGSLTFGWEGVVVGTEQFALSQATALMAANVVFPFALALAACYTNYYAQIDAYREMYGTEPSQAVKDKIWAESKQLGYKMLAAVGGWTFGYEIFAKLLMAFDPTGATHGAVLTSALVIGLTAATFLCIMAFMVMVKNEQEKSKGLSWFAAAGNVLNNNGLDLMKLFAIGTIAGASWHVINCYSYMPSEGLSPTLAKFLDYLLKGTMTYVAVSTVFTQLAPEQSAKELKTTSVLNSYSPIGRVDTETVKDEISLRKTKVLVTSMP